MTAETTVEAGEGLDPLRDTDTLEKAGVKHNFAKVGSARPSSLLYTYGPGAIMDLPQFTVMPAGLADWDRVWDRWNGPPPVLHAPRLRAAARRLMHARDVELRPFPWRPRASFSSTEGNDLGIPARVFPQWMRCTGCSALWPLSRFRYTNTHPFRTDEACFEHVGCPGRRSERADRAVRPSTVRRSSAVVARYLLACTDGHLDEFPYELWVHRGRPCPVAEIPSLRMEDRVAGKGAAATIHCDSCEARRPMNEAQGEAGRAKLPRCRGRHPHLDAFGDCDNETQLMLVGASNLWFPATQSIIVMPESAAESADALAEAVRRELDGDDLVSFHDQPRVVRSLLRDKVDLAEVSDDDLAAALATAAAPPVPPEEPGEEQRFDPVELLVPEWRYLLRDPNGQRHEDPRSGLTLSRRERHPALPGAFTRVLAVDRLRKVNALVGFTRVDDMDRVDDLPRRLAPLTRGTPTWTVATEDRGEGVFLQLDEGRVAAWEERVLASRLWEAHRTSHARNHDRRFSKTAEPISADERFPPPRYWLLHTLAHVLIRQAAMTCGYSAASLSERLYAWRPTAERQAAAGLLLCTTASDSDGTLGGLVQLSKGERLADIVNGALRRARRCSSDPVCATRTPKDPEDFLHGAACHCCAMASETSCERSNRFLDRRFLIDLPGSDLGFFDSVAD